MFRHDLFEPKTDKKKTDLLAGGTVRIHFIQDAKENEIGSDDKDSGRDEQECVKYDVSEVHPLHSIWPKSRLTRKPETWVLASTFPVSRLPGS
jgi:hypothetical protein